MIKKSSKFSKPAKAAKALRPSRKAHTMFKAAVINDRFLTKHFEELVDTYGGGFLLIGDGKILYTHKDGTPGQLVKRFRKEHPGVVPHLFRVPRPEDFNCIL